MPDGINKGGQKYTFFYLYRLQIVVYLIEKNAIFILNYKYIIMAKKNTEGENLSRIKEILFGEDLTSIEDRFEAFRKESSESLRKLEVGFAKKLSDLEKLINSEKEKVTEKYDENKEVQQTINKVVKSDLSKIASRLEEEKTKIKQLLIQTEEKTVAQSRKLEDNVLSSIENLKNKLNEKLENLNNSKASNDVIADIFQGIAEKLRK